MRIPSGTLPIFPYIRILNTVVQIMLISAHIYLLTNRNHTTLYTGVTTALRTRIWEHQTKSNPKSFTARYNVTKLVYHEGFETLIEAIAREKFIKRKSRQWKEDLIGCINPDWEELFPPE
jgi:putative endonuclease